MSLSISMEIKPVSHPNLHSKMICTPWLDGQTGVSVGILEASLQVPTFKHAAPFILEDAVDWHEVGEVGWGFLPSRPAESMTCDWKVDFPSVRHAHKLNKGITS